MTPTPHPLSVKWRAESARLRLSGNPLSWEHADRYRLCANELDAYHAAQGDWQQRADAAEARLARLVVIEQEMLDWLDGKDSRLPWREIMRWHKALAAARMGETP